MAFFSRDRRNEVPKGVPPDKRVGAWPSLWEHRVFEAAIRSWKSEANRKGRDLLEGAEERIRALSRKQKLTWVHNRLKDQKGIKE